MVSMREGWLCSPLYDGCLGPLTFCHFHLTFNFHFSIMRIVLYLGGTKTLRRQCANHSKPLPHLFVSQRQMWEKEEEETFEGKYWALFYIQAREVNNSNVLKMGGKQGVRGSLQTRHGWLQLLPRRRCR